MLINLLFIYEREIYVYSKVINKLSNFAFISNLTQPYRPVVAALNQNCFVRN